MRWWRYKQVVTIAVLSSVIFVAGCGQKVPISKYDLFAESTQTVLSHTTHTYSRIADFQHRFIVETLEDAPLNPQSFDPVSNGMSSDLVPELQLRKAALNVLIRYTQALQALAKDNSEENVDKAALNLAGSLKALSQRSKDTENGEKASSLLSSAVEAMGRTFVRGKIIDALKTVMASAQDDVERLSQLIVGSNEKIKKSIPIMLDRILAHNNLQRPPKDTIERVRFDGEVGGVINEAQEIKEALESLNRAVSQFPVAHSEIRSLIGEKPTTQEGLKLLIAEGQHLGEYNRSLK